MVGHANLNTTQIYVHSESHGANQPMKTYYLIKLHQTAASKLLRAVRKARLDNPVIEPASLLVCCRLRSNGRR